MKYVDKALEIVKETPRYAGQAAGKFGRYVWKEKLPIGIGLGATATAWGAVAGNSDNYVLSWFRRRSLQSWLPILRKERGMALFLFSLLAWLALQLTKGWST